MSKGMSLDEFKEQLDTDAQRRCKLQETTIKRMLNEIRELEDKIKEKEKTIHQMQKRCFVSTHGFLCVFCGFKNDCKAKK